MLTVQKGSVLGGPWVSYLEIFLISWQRSGKQADALQSPSASGVAKLVHQVIILEYDGIWLPGLSLVENMIYKTSYDEHWWTTYGFNFQRKLLLPDDNSLWKVPLVEFQAVEDVKDVEGLKL